MNKLHWFGISAILMALLVLVGCDNSRKEKPKGADGVNKKKEPEHVHGNGPNGGTVADWGGGKYHVEFCMDHKKKQATVYILGSDEKTYAPIKTDKLLLSIKQPTFQLDLKADPQKDDPKGTASRFVGTHDNFATEQEFAGTISGQIEGDPNPYAGDFKEEPDPNEKKK